MEWQTFGFKDDPLRTSPITKATLSLFTGHTDEVRVCMNVLKNSNVRLVIEGARGVGTTSFSNYLRFNAEIKKIYFTPRTEIKVEKGWRLETLLASIISNFVREIELRTEFNKIIDDKRFQKEVFDYLYQMTSGRLRYIFGLTDRLMNRLYIGDLTDKVTLDIAKPMLMKLGRDRIKKADLSTIEEQTLELLVLMPNVTSSVIAKKLKKTPQYIGRLLSTLAEKGLAYSKKEKRERIYSPSIDAVIAFTRFNAPLNQQ